MATDPEIFRHKEWLGLLQPVGLVVSPPALVKAQAVIDRTRAVEVQERLKEIVCTDPIQGITTGEEAWIKDFPVFAEQVLEWMPEDLVGAPGQEALPQQLEIVLPDYGETLKPTYAVRNPDFDSWLMLIQKVAPGQSLDEVDSTVEKGLGWKATVQEKFERLLRETEIFVGVLDNGTHLRLFYAPRGESSGHLTFPVQAMCEVPGRLILGALDMLLGADRLFNVPTERRLPKLLSDSRDYQAEVSTKLADQVLDALWELLRGFQTADAAINGRLLGELAGTDPQHIYGGLITTLMRLVFLLYAEDQGLMPGDDVYQRNYSITGLYDRLREDAGNYPDTMDQRYGAWAWLLSLFRLVYDGGGSTPEYLPARHGQLFEPDEYPFLEGRLQTSFYSEVDLIEPPRIPDGVIYRLLEKLLVLDGERLSYRALDVEQIGSVYEAIMGFEVEVAGGLSIAVRPKDVVVNVEDILKALPKDREKLLQQADCKLTGKALSALKEAKKPEEVVAALDRRVSLSRTPNLLPVGSLYLQPGEERRRTGSHYTPRKLTQPIVETTLRPVLEALGEHPRAEQILSLKVCDLAMGSGAFLVEACRQLGEQVMEAWSRDDQLKDVPDDVEPLLAARRLVAQRCLYGVDKNPFAVNLAKLSLWLVTLAKDRPFTFLDHALKCGDSLVGLTRAEIGSFGKDPLDDLPLLKLLKEKVDRAKSYRTEIQALDTRTDQDAEDKVARLKQAEHELEDARLTGDIAVAAFFDGAGKSKKEREEIQESYSALVREWRQSYVQNYENKNPDIKLKTISDRLRSAEKTITPFNWEIEFPEVFDQENSGFDAIVGNPPFLGGRSITTNFGKEYSAWLIEKHPESSGGADLVAHFFRRAFTILREGGCFGLIATNTIAQGDTRSSGLRYICQENRGTIYNAQKRVKWPGLAAVVVSVINIIKGSYEEIKNLDRRATSKITAFLFHAGGNENPSVLLANANKSFQGSIVLGMGFTFDDNNPDATAISKMHRLIEENPRNDEHIFPYIGGEEVNSSPTHAHNRYVINFGEMSEKEAGEYPDLMKILEEKVKSERQQKSKEISQYPWWKFWRTRQELYEAIAQCDRVLVIARISKSFAFTFLPKGMVYNEKIVVFPFDTYSAFTSLQSRIHEVWTRFFSSTMKDDLQYTPSDCFETFPFPENWETNPTLETVGKEYYEFRADLMVRNNQGLTDTYNRFHDPDERDSDILKLRELHAKMDRAVLDAYGWTDIPTNCEFLLDYEEEEDESNSRRKKPWRYRWSEENHDEVLARLLDLNQKRHEAEILGGKHAETKAKSKKSRKPKAPKSTQTNVQQQTLFEA
ncbi:MAG TPA: SAM-dependent methyltransferase [Cyanobacteria bacterium UBA8553]|nr:SAM-dependent methyltransferase [Cyanobacteria bacterium UBA8553]